MDKLICIGKNYADHAKELGEPLPEKPVIFFKPPSCLTELKDQQAVRLPWELGEIHYECEVVLKLYKKNVIAVGLGLDLTLRHLQKELKTKGQPWEISKCFKHSALLAPLVGQRDFPDWRTTPFEFFVNDERRQHAALTDAIFGPDQAIHHAAARFPICDGDLVFTGTPAGVGPLKPWDKLRLSWGPVNLEFRVVE